MYEKKLSIKLDGFETFNSGIVASGIRFFALSEDEILLISNNEEKFILDRYAVDGHHISRNEMDYEYGHLAGITLYDGDLWLEFRDILAMYEEHYSIVRITSFGPEQVFSMQRESYMHDMKYHSLFVEDGELYLNLVRHNRMHHYRISGGMEEIDVQEGGKWYLCGNNPLCLVGGMLELYDPRMNILNTVEYDYEIDEIFADHSVTPPFMALTLTDISQQHTSLLIHHFDTQSLHIAYIENAIADMGISGGRVWLNPYGFHIQQEFGGCMIYDRFAWPLYIHLRTKGQGGNMGTYPPPYHRSEGVYAAPAGLTLVAEPTRLLLFDYNGRAVQEVGIPHSDCVAVSQSGALLAVLQLDRHLYLQDKVAVQDAVLDIYHWNHDYEGDKVIEMSKFRDKE